MELKNKVVIITGAAGRIGSATAEKLLKNGANVVLADINQDNLVKLYDLLLQKKIGKLTFFKCDITLESEINALLTYTFDFFGGIHAAIHCAYPVSLGWGTKFEEIKSENLFKDLTMQLGSAIIFSQKVLEFFKYNGGGDLIHVSSIQGVQAPKFEHYEGTEMTSPLEYTAIKSGIIAITQWLAKYYANYSIRVNCISPGGIKDNQPSTFINKYRKSCTNIGLLSPDDISSCIAFLLESGSKAINGQNLIIDDGWTL